MFGRSKQPIDESSDSGKMLNSGNRVRGNNNKFEVIYNYGISEEEVNKIVNKAVEEILNGKSVSDNTKDEIIKAVEDKTASILLAVAQEGNLTRETIGTEMTEKLSGIETVLSGYITSLKTAISQNSSDLSAIKALLENRDDAKEQNFNIAELEKKIREI